MPKRCTPVELPGGGRGIICTSTRTRRCRWCGAGATLLCDGPGPLGEYDARTCDAPVCKACAKHVGPDEDLCPRCAARDLAAERIEHELERAGMLDDKPRSGAPGVSRCACGALGVRRCVYEEHAGHPANRFARVLGVAKCGKPLCDACAVPVGPRREQCPDHPRP